MKRTIIYLIAFICGAVVGASLNNCTKKHLSTIEEANFNTLPFKIELIRALEEYYNTTETLLDSIENHYSFCDVFSDPVQDYLWARHDVDSLLVPDTVWINRMLEE